MSIRAIPLAAAVVAAAMLLPAAAGAKEIESAIVCGADGCQEIAVKGDAHRLLEGGSLGKDLTKTAPFYTLQFGIGDGSGKVFDTFVMDYVPSAGKVRGVDGLWADALPSTARALDAAVRGIEPRPASDLNLAHATVSDPDESLPPELVTGPAPAPAPAQAAADGGTSAWLVALVAAGGLALLGGALLLLRRRLGGGPRPVVAP